MATKHQITNKNLSSLRGTSSLSKPKKPVTAAAVAQEPEWLKRMSRQRRESYFNSNPNSKYNPNRPSNHTGEMVAKHAANSNNIRGLGKAISSNAHHGAAAAVKTMSGEDKRDAMAGAQALQKGGEPDVKQKRGLWKTAMYTGAGAAGAAGLVGGALMAPSILHDPEHASEVLNHVGNSIKEAGQGAFNKFSDLAGHVSNSVGQHFHNAADKISAGASRLADHVKNHIPQEYVDSVKNAGKAAGDKVGEGVDWAKSGLHHLSQTADNAWEQNVAPHVAAGAKAAGDAYDSAKHTVGDAADKAGKAIGDAADSVKKGASDLADKAGKTAGEAVDSVKKGASDLADKAGKAAGNAYDSAKSGANELADKAGKAASETYDSAKSAVGDAAKKAGSAISEGVDKARSAVGLPTSDEKTVENINESLKDAPKPTGDVGKDVGAAADKQVTQQIKDQLGTPKTAPTGDATKDVNDHITKQMNDQIGKPSAPTGDVNKDIADLNDRQGKQATDEINKQLGPADQDFTRNAPKFNVKGPGDIAKEGLDSAGKAVNDAYDRGSKALGDDWAELKGMGKSAVDGVGDAYNSAKNTISDAIDNGTKTVNQMGDDAKSNLGGTWDAIKNGAGKAYDNAKNELSDNYDTATKRVDSLSEGAKKSLSDLALRYGLKRVDAE